MLLTGVLTSPVRNSISFFFFFFKWLHLNIKMNCTYALFLMLTMSVSPPMPTHLHKHTSDAEVRSLTTAVYLQPPWSSPSTTRPGPPCWGLFTVYWRPHLPSCWRRSSSLMTTVTEVLLFALTNKPVSYFISQRQNKWILNRQKTSQKQRAESLSQLDFFSLTAWKSESSKTKIYNI